MQAILLGILPLAAIAVIGYLAVRFDYVSQAANDGISKFVFVVALPALIFRNMSNSNVAGNLDFIWGALAAYYIGALAILVVGIVIAQFALKAGKAEQNLIAVGASHSNMVLLGVPAVLMLLGPKLVMPMAIIVGLHGMLMAILLTVVLRTRSGKAGEIPSAIWGSFVNQAKNPIFIALVAGIIYDLAPIPKLPGEVNTILRTLGDATYPCALFALGGMMVRYKFQGNGVEAVAVSALKMVAFPVTVFLLARLFGLNQWAWAAAMLAAMPVGFNMHNMASRSEKGGAIASSSILLSTILAVVAAAAVLYFRKYG